MTTASKPSASIIAAGIVEIICSLLTALGTAMSLMVFRSLPIPDSNPQLPPAIRTLMDFMMTLFLALAIFGIFTGAGLLGLKNRARIATLIWASIIAAISALTLLLVPFMPFPDAPNQPVGMEQSIRIFLVVIYGIPLALGIWWLVLFNRQAIVAQFHASTFPLGQDVVVMPGESFPFAAPAAAKPACPLPVAVVAGSSIFCSLSIVFVFFLRLPAVIFGHSFHGSVGTGIWVLSCTLYAASGVGLLLLKPWSHILSMGLQYFFLCSGTVSLTTSNFDSLMREALASSPMWTSQGYTEQYFHQLRSFSALGLVFPVVILVVLLYNRARFVEAAAADSSS